MEDVFQHELNLQKWQLGQHLKARIVHIYDPTKLWLVTKHRELDQLHKLINKQYFDTYKSLYLKAEDLKNDYLCIVYTNDAFYRGCICRIVYSNNGAFKVQVFLVDFAYVELVDLDCLFYMDDRLRTIPKLAVRALLYNVCPRNGHKWTTKAIDEFYKVVENQVINIKIHNIDYKNKILSISILTSTVQNVGQHLIKQNLAIHSKSGLSTFLYPTHQRIEKGLHPHTHELQLCLSKYSHFDSLDKYQSTR